MPDDFGGVFAGGSDTGSSFSLAVPSASTFLPIGGGFADEATSLALPPIDLSSVISELPEPFGLSDEGFGGGPAELSSAFDLSPPVGGLSSTLNSGLPSSAATGFGNNSISSPNQITPIGLQPVGVPNALDGANNLAQNAETTALQAQQEGAAAAAQVQQPVTVAPASAPADTIPAVAASAPPVVDEPPPVAPPATPQTEITSVTSAPAEQPSTPVAPDTGANGTGANNLTDTSINGGTGPNANDSAPGAVGANAFPAAGSLADNTPLNPDGPQTLSNGTVVASDVPASPPLDLSQPITLSTGADGVGILANGPISSPFATQISAATGFGDASQPIDAATLTNLLQGFQSQLASTDAGTAQNASSLVDSGISGIQISLGGTDNGANTTNNVLIPSPVIDLSNLPGGDAANAINQTTAAPMDMSGLLNELGNVPNPGGDGPQQLMAIPIVDPATGQSTIMILGVQVPTNQLSAALGGVAGGLSAVTLGGMGVQLPSHIGVVGVGAVGTLVGAIYDPFDNTWHAPSNAQIYSALGAVAGNAVGSLLAARMGLTGEAGNKLAAVTSGIGFLAGLNAGNAIDTDPGRATGIMFSILNEGMVDPSMMQALEDALPPPITQSPGFSTTDLYKTLASVVSQSIVSEIPGFGGMSGMMTLTSKTTGLAGVVATAQSTGNSGPVDGTIPLATGPVLPNTNINNISLTGSQTNISTADTGLASSVSAAASDLVASTPDALNGVPGTITNSPVGSGVSPLLPVVVAQPELQANPVGQPVPLVEAEPLPSVVIAAAAPPAVGPALDAKGNLTNGAGKVLVAAAVLQRAGVTIDGSGNLVGPDNNIVASAPSLQPGLELNSNGDIANTDGTTVISAAALQPTVAVAYGNASNEVVTLNPDNSLGLANGGVLLPISTSPDGATTTLSDGSTVDTASGNVTLANGNTFSPVTALEGPAAGAVDNSAGEFSTASANITGNGASPQEEEKSIIVPSNPSPVTLASIGAASETVFGNDNKAADPSAELAVVPVDLPPIPPSASEVADAFLDSFFGNNSGNNLSSPNLPTNNPFLNRIRGLVIRHAA